MRRLASPTPTVDSPRAMRVPTDILTDLVPPVAVEPEQILLPEAFVAAATSQAKVSSCPHNLYKYPARFAPEFAREAIRAFSQPGDLILDCFHGGGTTGAVASSIGRRAVGYDISSLACFLAKVKSTPLTVHDERALLAWSEQLGLLNDPDAMQAWVEADTEDGYYRRNLPQPALLLFANIIAQIQKLEKSRQRRFARLALLAVGQWALDCKKRTPTTPEIRDQYRRQLAENVTSFRSYIRQTAKDLDVPPATLGRQVKVVHASSEKCGSNGKIEPGSVSLVVTSPPYPGVHMLYHRWQLHGRREMPAPFLLANCRDGDGISFYSLGHRKEEGLKTYFERLTRIFTAVRPCLKPNALVIQMVAFNKPHWQLPEFLRSMDAAGFRHVLPASDQTAGSHLWRAVPGRRWYANLNPSTEASKEVVLFHKLK